MSALKAECEEYKLSKAEEFGWAFFIGCCIVAAICAFVIAGIELNIG